MARKNTNQTNMKSFLGSFWGGFMIAAVMGVIAIGTGLLKAPQSGEELRDELETILQEIQEGAEQIVANAQTQVGQVTDQVTNGAADFQARTAAAAKEAQRAAHEAQKGAQKAQKHAKKAVAELA